MPSPIFTKKLKESLPTEEGEESEEERDIEMEPTSEEKGTKQEQEGSIQEDFPRYSEEEEKEDSEKLDESKEIQLNEKKILKNEEEEDKDLLWFEKSLVTLLFDYKRWNRPLRYIKNDRFENASLKKVPRWSYKLTDEFEEEEQEEEENEEETTEDPEIRSRKAKRVVIFNDNSENSDTDTSTSTSDNSNQAEEVALIRYSQQPDFRRDLIKGSMRAQRRKTTICEMFQGNDRRFNMTEHIPFFQDRIKVIREVSDSKTRHKKLRILESMNGKTG
ncbi:hypothetical protein H6P81_021362 [Aristolochia fimbriata]|uniref:Translocon at the inner envelope membrane of chloroplasts 214 n=1 Tax=Aristolochia fimbriata TaxID=158543 RepID=A0AAV7DR59_ARIFI|nr:hypothetical protein H6P81_021362 [Aristolochia fimbriata]